MNKLCAGLVVAALLAAAGCHPGTTGGPGTPGGKSGVLGGPAENTFKLSTPTLSTHLKQGEAKEDTISLDRGKNFDQDVNLEFKKLPTGVTIDPASPTIKHGDKDVKVTVKAADDAALGDHTIEVVGKPAKSGAEAVSELKITVSKK